MEEIGALFLATSTTLYFLGASVISLGIVGLKAGGTDVTFVEEPGETGDDIVMVFLVEQDQLFGLGGSETFDVVRMVRIDQEDLVVVERRGGTELHQPFVPARTKRDMGFVVEQLRLLFLYLSTLLNDLHLGWRFTMALAVTRARAQHRSSLFWMRMTVFLFWLKSSGN